MTPGRSMKNRRSLYSRRRQLYRHAVFTGPALQQMEGDPIGAQLPGRLLKMPASAEDGVDPGQKDRQLEGLCNVVVAAHVQAHDDAGFRVRGGEKDDGDLGGLPNLFAELEAGAVREGNVQDQQVVVPLLPQVFGLVERAGNFHLMARLLKGKGKPVNQAQIILQQQQLAHTEPSFYLKQMAAALQYLREQELADYAALEASTETAVDRFHKLAGELRDTEAALSKTARLMEATVDYAKTRPVFDGYKAARYSKKYLAQHEAELAAYRAAKAAMNEILDGAKLPKIDTLKKSRRELAEKKKALYAEYRQAQADMREAVAVKANIDHLLGVTDGRENKAQER